MVIDLTGRVVMITAGATKAGRLFAQEFAKSGADIVISYLPFQAEAAERTKAEVEALGKKCLAVETDLNYVDQLENLVSETDKFYGRLDGLILNAATTHVVDFEEMTENDWDESNRVIAKASAFLSRAAAKVMMKNKYGRIIGIGGNSFYENDPIVIPHGNAKVGMAKALQGIAVQYTPYIMCNTVNMNMFYPMEDSDFNEREADYGDTAYANLGGVYEFAGRKWQCLDTQGVADFLIFLVGCRPSCAINGENIAMDGGMGLNCYRY